LKINLESYHENNEVNQIVKKQGVLKRKMEFLILTKESSGFSKFKFQNTLSVKK